MFWRGPSYISNASTEPSKVETDLQEALVLVLVLVVVEAAVVEDLERFEAREQLNHPTEVHTVVEGVPPSAAVLGCDPSHLLSLARQHARQPYECVLQQHRRSDASGARSLHTRGAGA